MVGGTTRSTADDRSVREGQRRPDLSMVVVAICAVVALVGLLPWRSTVTASARTECTVEAPRCAATGATTGDASVRPISVDVVCLPVVPIAVTTTAVADTSWWRTEVDLGRPCVLGTLARDALVLGALVVGTTTIRRARRRSDRSHATQPVVA